MCFDLFPVHVNTGLVRTFTGLCVAGASVCFEIGLFPVSWYFKKQEYSHCLAWLVWFRWYFSCPLIRYENSELYKSLPYISRGLMWPGKNFQGIVPCTQQGRIKQVWGSGHRGSSLRKNYLLLFCNWVDSYLLYSCPTAINLAGCASSKKHQ